MSGRRVRKEKRYAIERWNVENREARKKERRRINGEDMPAVTARAFFSIEGRPGEESNMNADELGVSLLIVDKGD